MPEDVNVTDADRAAGKRIAKIDFINDKPHGLSESAYANVVAFEIARAMAPERERSARMEKALRKCVETLDQMNAARQLTERFTPGDKWFESLYEARAALGEDA